MSDQTANRADTQSAEAREKPGTPERITAFDLAGLIAGPLVSFLILLLPAPDGMSEAAWSMVAVAAWMVIWWLTEAVPIPATALLPIPLMPLYGVLGLDETTAKYADDLIFLFLGGFILAAGLQNVGLHRRIALTIIDRIGTTPQRIVLGFMLATGFLSMWISNTATSIMMYAVGLSVVSFVSERTRDRSTVRNFGVALMLAIAYSASIGGVGTLIGTPPNALLASYLASERGTEISFFQWMLLGVPVVLIMMPLAWLLLTRVLFPSETIDIDASGSVIRDELKALGGMSRSEKIVGVVFVLTALSWIGRDGINWLTGLDIDDTQIAIIAALLLFAIPVSRAEGRYTLDWETARDIPWGVLLLFGGGLALAAGFNESGLAEWIGNAVSSFRISTMLLVLVVLVCIVYLTEITSNTASTATFLPILGAVAVGLNLAPEVLCVPVALGASMAFMMPVATPPNAIVFSYEEMKLNDMVRAGFFLNIIAIAVAYGLFVVLGPVVFGISLSGGG